MAELRRDPIVGRWVIVGTDNSLAPEDFDKEEHKIRQRATCQFCYGREHLTPPEIEAARPAHTAPNSPGWSVRVFPNKFPALRIEGELERRGFGVFTMSNGIGAHEIVVETPDHDKQLADLSVGELQEVVKKYRSRCFGLAQDKRFKYVIVFKNYGQSAGATVEHAHTQVIALPMVPKYVLEELEGAQHYFEYKERCIFCDIIKQEYEDQNRIVFENKDFICFCPFVSRYAFETWIIPKRHAPQFFEMSDEEQYHLASAFKEIFMRLKICLSDPSYNFFLHTSPVNYDHKGIFHWHIEIVPKLSREAGFEWGTGFYVVPTTPHMAAKYLRDVKVAV